MGSMRCWLLAVLAQGARSAPAPKPHIIFMLADDLGWYDTSVTGDQSPESKLATANLSALADVGMKLARHYVHWHCSPTRRSFLSGRSPLHHGEQLSGVESDDMDLRWTWISEKLVSAGYVAHYYGKGHTGYESMQHLPANRGFAGGSVLYLGGAGSYYNLARWNGTEPLLPHTETYSTDLFGSLAVKAIESHDKSVPLFMYLPWQAVHAPYDLPPNCAGADQGGTDSCPVKIRAMIHDVDLWTGRLVSALKRKGMYRNTLMVFSSDNGGTQDGTEEQGGNNYPLRGGKHTNWQGGMRTTTFVSGGFLPFHVRGTTHSGTFHIVDWYPTFCGLAGVDGSDDAPVAPEPVDPDDPTKDIYGTDSWPSLDGVDIWPELVGEAADSGRKYLWLSAEVVIKDGRYKIVTAQQDPHITNNPPVTGWRNPDGSWEDGGELDGRGCGVAYKDRTVFRPCLFDLDADEREKHDISASEPDLVEELWAELNRTALTAFRARSPDHRKGHCDQECADKKWTDFYGKKCNGPICGVPGCDGGDVAILV